MIMTMVPEAKVEPVLAGLRPLFDTPGSVRQRCRRESAGVFWHPGRRFVIHADAAHGLSSNRTSLVSRCLKRSVCGQKPYSPIVFLG